jgi:Rrf2 family protein
MANMLKISEAASLALHTMSLLARHPGQRFANQEMATLLQVSEHTLAKVMQRLARAGLVASSRGPAGGFVLNRPPAQITVLSIYEAVDGPLGCAGCLLGNGPCVAATCRLGGLAAKVHELVRREFTETTLETLAESMKLGDWIYGTPAHH